MIPQKDCNIPFHSPSRIQYPWSWVGHIPFVYDLIRVLTPNVIVELGTHSGNSLLAMAQSVRDHSFNTTLYGVDTWEGEEHAGHYDLHCYTGLCCYVKDNYHNEVFLVRDTFDNAADRFKSNSIDLLHIDGLHTYDAVSHDWMTWKSKLQSTGVVMFHDIHEKKRDFGVWRFWEEIKREHEVRVEFDHSHGLGVIYLGGRDGSAIATFVDDLSHHSEQRQLYRLVGEWLTYSHQLPAIQSARDAIRRSPTYKIARRLGAPVRILRRLRKHYTRRR